VLRVLLLLLLLLLLLGTTAQDVPAALNGLLDSLPSKVSIQGLPFDAVFTYALYTLNYVIVKVSWLAGLWVRLKLWVCFA
jgi:hypothetical protein